MTKKIYYLGTCSTCARIIKDLKLGSDFVYQDIKTEAITADQLTYMREKAGSYEALFSRRAMKFRAMGLHEQQLDEDDYRRLILGEYTFLKRPVILIGEEIFVGNTKPVVAAAAEALEKAG